MIVRRVQVGPDMKNAMNYLVGQDVMRGAGVIKTIRVNDNYDVEVWVLKEGEIFLWKTIMHTMPFTLEYELDF
jgi:hypothetical protein